MKLLNNEPNYVVFHDPISFHKWCIEGDWGGLKEFENATGVKFEEIVGVSFQVIHNRIFFKE
jgi:hypothetical protein